jgi:endonuclease/exonuclease/phosphatase family metal-dependent hydrolase
MGDFNCTSQSDELRAISARTGLKPSIRNIPTYPSCGTPGGIIDHILVSEGISISRARTIDFPMSDHLPLAIEAVIRRRTDNAAHALSKAA